MRLNALDQIKAVINDIQFVGDREIHASYDAGADKRRLNRPALDRILGRQLMILILLIMALHATEESALVAVYD